VQVAFEGGLQSSDGGVLLLREVDRRLGLAERLAADSDDFGRAFRAEVGHRFRLMSAGRSD
jgi:hypothetical protein